METPPPATRPGTPLRRIQSLAFFFALVFAAAAFGASFSPGPWYDGLEKPPWNPPAWVFGPVWTCLYIAMAIAAHRIWWRRGEAAHRRATHRALALWAVQLVLNALWSWLFFGLHWPAVALVEMVLLLAAIAATTRAFSRLDRSSAWLLVPYLAWVSYALTLNAAIAWLNR